jgi:hypothetical protein
LQGASTLIENVFVSVGGFKVADEQNAVVVTEGDSQNNSQSRRKIPGNLPYTPSAGVLARILEKLPIVEKPNVFNTDFLSTVLGATGGSARPIIPIFKATGLLNQSGSPTDLYGQFQTEGGRAQAALHALRNGFGEIFKRNQYAHKADDNALTDIIVAITGLPKNERVVQAIRNTFQVFQGYAKAARDELTPGVISDVKTLENQSARPDEDFQRAAPATLGLVYNINIVLPETTNVEVYNAIFKSLRSNLLQ